jgi:hypothetical protein
VPVVCGRLATGEAHAKKLEGVSIAADRSVAVARLEPAPVLIKVPTPAYNPPPLKSGGNFVESFLSEMAKQMYDDRYPVSVQAVEARNQQLTADHNSAMARYSQFPMVFLGEAQVAGGEAT